MQVIMNMIKNNNKPLKIDVLYDMIITVAADCLLVPPLRGCEPTAILRQEAPRRCMKNFILQKEGHYYGK